MDGWLSYKQIALIMIVLAYITEQAESKEEAANIIKKLAENLYTGRIFK